MGTYLHSPSEKWRPPRREVTYPRSPSHSTVGMGWGLPLLLPPPSHHPQMGGTVRLGGQLPGECMEPLVPTPSARQSTPGPFKCFSGNGTAGLLRANLCMRKNECQGEAGCFIRSVHVLVLILIFQKFETSVHRRYIFNHNKDNIREHESFLCNFSEAGGHESCPPLFLQSTLPDCSYQLPWPLGSVAAKFLPLPGLPMKHPCKRGLPIPSPLRAGRGNFRAVS